ncbi:uncharacterized protein LOC106013578 [Aplysia californica]|uniref:Uncharacterized protein LOC106013578 n=1 Tax=Aplysia californica TaxID=6500 RepID=A0ABM1ACN3_APLCA|nr:uncharacterized protein LOC106013578 [Aplysia californica]
MYSVTGASLCALVLMVCVQAVYPIGLKSFEETLFFDLGYEKEEYAGRYYLSNPLTNSFDAQYACSKISNNGFLSEFDTDGERAFIIKQIEPYVFATERIHIGGENLNTGGGYSTGSNSSSSSSSSGNDPPTYYPPETRECNALVKRSPSRFDVVVVSCTRLVARFLCEIDDSV